MEGKTERILPNYPILLKKKTHCLRGGQGKSLGRGSRVSRGRIRRSIQKRNLIFLILTPIVKGRGRKHHEEGNLFEDHRSEASTVLG
jgi:hypothetical protein